MGGNAPPLSQVRGPTTGHGDRSSGSDGGGYPRACGSGTHSALTSPVSGNMGPGTLRLDIEVQ